MKVTCDELGKPHQRITDCQNPVDVEEKKPVSFKKGDKVRFKGSSFEFEVWSEPADSWVPGRWTEPGGEGHVYANLPASELELAPESPLPVGTILRDDEGDTWVAIKPGEFIFLTVDGIVEDRIDFTDPESIDFIRREYGSVEILFNPEA